jgi:hypothetical protein
MRSSRPQMTTNYNDDTEGNGIDFTAWRRDLLHRYGLALDPTAIQLLHARLTCGALLFKDHKVSVHAPSCVVRAVCQVLVANGGDRRSENFNVSPDTLNGAQELANRMRLPLLDLGDNIDLLLHRTPHLPTPTTHRMSLPHRPSCGKFQFVCRQLGDALQSSIVRH